MQYRWSSAIPSGQGFFSSALASAAGTTVAIALARALAVGVAALATVLAAVVATVLAAATGVGAVGHVLSGALVLVDDAGAATADRSEQAGRAPQTSSKPARKGRIGVVIVVMNAPSVKRLPFRDRLSLPLDQHPRRAGEDRLDL